MNQTIVQSPTGVTLAGGGPIRASDLRIARLRAPFMAAADGGAAALMARGILPEVVIGDMDSLPPVLAAKIPADRLHPIPEQESTDFDKALRSISAPLILGIGFLGGRADHMMAALSTLAQHHHRPCILIGAEDLVFAAPPRPLELHLRIGQRLSLWPLAEVQGRSQGLRWSLAGEAFTPLGRIGTSNEVAEARVRLDFDRPGMLVILPRSARNLDAAIRGLCRE